MGHRTKSDKIVNYLDPSLKLKFLNVDKLLLKANINNFFIAIPMTVTLVLPVF